MADRYEMGPGHIDELEELFAAPVAPIVANLDGDDVEGARGLVDDVWNRLEKRLRSKWQAYFVLTFQDVSVERKAARDRKKQTPRFDQVAAETLARAAGDARVDARLRRRAGGAGARHVGVDRGRGRCWRDRRLAAHARPCAPATRPAH